MFIASYLIVLASISLLAGSMFGGLAGWSIFGSGILLLDLLVASIKK